MRRSPGMNLLVFSVSLCLCGSSSAAALQSLAVYPPDVQLNSARARQTVVVQAAFADGITRDVTAEAKLTLSNPALAKLAGNVLTPAADGAGELRVEYDGKTLTVPVVVKDATADRPISFKRDVMPIFMRAGCNVGTCHGSA
ncbi:MAG TPA: cell surface protein, partial [Gemmataceae bacterium]|nr:cell surface protein [Gemmataceae bacterium]